jgi:hypothetical protein
VIEGTASAPTDSEKLTETRTEPRQACQPRGESQRVDRAARDLPFATGGCGSPTRLSSLVLIGRQSVKSGCSLREFTCPETIVRCLQFHMRAAGPARAGANHRRHLLGAEHRGSRPTESSSNGSDLVALQRFEKLYRRRREADIDDERLGVASRQRSSLRPCRARKRHSVPRSARHKTVIPFLCLNCDQFARESRCFSAPNTSASATKTPPITQRWLYQSVSIRARCGSNREYAMETASPVANRTIDC